MPRCCTLISLIIIFQEFFQILLINYFSKEELSGEKSEIEYDAQPIPEYDAQPIPTADEDQDIIDEFKKGIKPYRLETGTEFKYPSTLTSNRTLIRVPATVNPRTHFSSNFD